MIISAARGQDEHDKTVFHTKKGFVVAAVMRSPAYTLLLLKPRHHFCPLVRLASNTPQIITNINPGWAHCKDRCISVISYRLIWFERAAAMPVLLVQEKLQINLQFGLKNDDVKMILAKVHE